MRLKDQVAIVTGAAQGIGAHYAWGRVLNFAHAKIQDLTLYALLSSRQILNHVLLPVRRSAV